MTIPLAVKIPLKLCSLWSITNSLFKPHNDMLALRQIPCNIKVNLVTLKYRNFYSDIINSVLFLHVFLIESK